MPYIGNPIYQSAFVTDQFSGTGSQTAYTMSVAPAGTTNVLVVVSGVVQDPSTYGVVGNTLNFTTAPPSGTGNISCRYLGVPVTGVTTTAYRTVTEFTATAGQTTFTPPSYTVGYISVYLNGVLLGSADYTASNGTTVVLATGASAGNILTVESFSISSVANAIPNAAGAVSSSNIVDGAITAAKMASSGAWAPAGTVVQVVSAAATLTGMTTTSTSFVTTGFSLSISPRLATSKILVTVMGGGAYCGTTAATSMFCTIYRGATNLGDASYGLARYSTVGGSFALWPHSFSVYDSPATTSSTTYTVYLKSSNGNQVDFQNTDRGIPVMTAMEITQ